MGPLGPLVLDQTDDRDFVELAIARGLVVKEAHAVSNAYAVYAVYSRAPRIRQERLPLDPPPHRGRQIADRPRRIVKGRVRGPELRQEIDHRGSSPTLLRRKRIIVV